MHRLEGLVNRTARFDRSKAKIDAPLRVTIIAPALAEFRSMSRAKLFFFG